MAAAVPLLTDADLTVIDAVQESVEPGHDPRQRCNRRNAEGATDLRPDSQGSNRSCSKRGGSKKRQAISNDHMEELASGVFLDFIVRTMHQLAQMEKGKEDATTHGVLAIVHGDEAAEQMFPMFKVARSFYQRELLEFNMMETLALDLKKIGREQSKIGWQPTKAGSLKMHASRVRQAKHDCFWLGDRVSNFCMRVTMMRNMRNRSGVMAKSVESVSAKKDRLKQFWMTYHNVHRERECVKSDQARSRRNPVGVVPFAQREQWKISCEGPRDPSSIKRSSPVAKSMSQPSLQSSKSSGNVDKVFTGRMLRADHAKHYGLEGPGGPRSMLRPPMPSSSQVKYFRQCDNTRAPPVVMPFVTGHSACIDSSNIHLDEQVLAITSMIQEGRRVEEVNLSDNAFLTDLSLVPFLECLQDAAADSLKKLNLSCCNKVGLATLEATIQLLELADNLQHLNLSGMQLSARIHLPLCTAVGHHSSIEVVNLAETGLGGTVFTKQCMRRLFESKTMHTLDLSWNVFDGAAFKDLGERVVANMAIRALRVSNCCAGFVGQDAPVSFFIEEVSNDEGLTDLDISLNRIDAHTAHVVENCYIVNKSLTRLDISQNLLGAVGLRSVLRMLAQETNVLKYVEIEGCYQGSVGDDDSGVKVFSRTNPGGLYRLNLARPYHRALLRMLYSTADRFKCVPDEAFLNVDYSLAKYCHASKDGNGFYTVLKEGVLTFVFSLEKAIEAMAAKLDRNDFGGFVALYFETARIKLTPQKMIPVFALWNDLKGKAMEQLTFLEALAKDFDLTLPILEYACKSAEALVGEIILRLMPTLPADSATRALSFLQFPRLGEFVRVKILMCGLLNFNSGNPSGHYKLDLGNCCDNAVATQLLLIDRWEVSVDKGLNRVDISQRGNRSHIRNECHQGRSLALQYASIAEWSPPEYDFLEFDYVCGRRASSTSLTLSPACFGKLLLHLYESECPAQEKVQAMRKVSSHFYVTAMQMRQMLGFFQTAEERIDMTLVYFLRIVDVHNAKVFRVRFEDQQEVVQLQNRLGYVTFFPCMQPENCQMELDLAQNDQRICASILVQLSGKEKPSNMRDSLWIRPDGVYDRFSMGVPRSWENVTSMPTGGIFSSVYVSAPEDRQFAFRKTLTETYSFFPCEVTVDEVMWWTGLLEPPADVLELLEFLIGRFKNHKQVFRCIAGTADKKVINFREFEEAIQEMGCTKFKDPPAKERERVLSVFRYLDPGGEGSVSNEEWDMIGQLWNEFELSVREFVQFLQRVYGDDLSIAWTALDEDGSGGLDEEEWLNAVEALGYFGPAKVVFNLLDTNDDGEVNREEFAVLESYKANSGS